ncbi:DUF5777 family beta-barrel protein [Polaribacter sp. Hel1_85]|uniref:DUF5777 family beta-barrel protein n=1 Tax=Polaribacter sp. Hel1_85 TaxID=1250005 RepID=UPI00052D86CB|nr:DUF5777 family beta-barrel protein [Polaribacter sp. Hel1_85]KGL64154.1 hypothetical protein PHEL85_1206 [Polaribacter sp. Hel1_85]
MKNKKIYPLFVVLFFLTNSSLIAQSLLDKLDSEFPDKPVYEIATFKMTRIGLGHSIETRKKGALEISLYNRYWNIPNFGGERFLADKVSTRYGLEYAFLDNFTVGFGYTNFDKISDGYLKYRLLKQQKGSKKTPISITLLQTISNRKTTNTGLYGKETSTNNNAFTSQVLIARKFNPDLSIQITPTFIYNTATATNDDPNTQFAIGFGGRHKIGGHASVVSEYYYVANPLKSIDTYNAFMVGVNWELSHLLLQFHITNARNYAEDTFITKTTHNFNFKDPNLHFGFNATFVLHTKKKKLK